MQDLQEQRHVFVQLLSVSSLRMMSLLSSSSAHAAGTANMDNNVALVNKRDETM